MSINLKICMGTHCTMMGNLNIEAAIEGLQEEYPGQIEIQPIKCLKFCKNNQAPVVELNGEIITNATVERVVSEIITKLE